MREEVSKDLVSIQYKKTSLFLVSWRRIRSNPGAMFGLCLISIIILIALFSIIFIDYEQVTAMDSKMRFQPSSMQHLFGTDEYGRDLFLRVLYGSRYSLVVAFGAVGFGFIIGTFFGAIAGYFGGKVEEVIMRLTDIIAAIPALLLGMVIVTILGPGLKNLLVSIGFSSIATFIRMTRASVLSVKSNEYVEASRAIGMSHFRIIFTQVLPNSVSPLIVTATARMATAVLAAASLSFLGFGISAPTPEWGAMISGGRAYLSMAPHLTFFPGLFIMSMTFACALLGDGLRDALDPRLKR